MAQILSETSTTVPPKRSVTFILFDGEELGLYGSTHYAQTLAAAAESIGCVLNTDMVGWTTDASPNRFWFLFAELHTPAAAMGLEALADFVPEASPIVTAVEFAGSSDHAPFWHEGYCALAPPTIPTPSSSSTTFAPPKDLDILATGLIWLRCG